MADDTSPSTSNLRFPDWQLKYQAALLEVDPQKLPERVKVADSASYGGPAGTCRDRASVATRHQLSQE
jgi:hypothetical protein